MTSKQSTGLPVDAALGRILSLDRDAWRVLGARIYELERAILRHADVCSRAGCSSELRQVVLGHNQDSGANE